MQTLKNDVRERIVETARQQFASKGYLKSSMRDIAARSGVGLGNIYNYFDNKDAVFRAAVYPVVVRFEQMLQKHHGGYGSDVMRMMSEEYFREVTGEYVSLIGQYRPLMRILFFCAQGSSLENFRESFTDRATELVKEWFAENKRKYPQINDRISDFSIHLHTVWMFSLFEEIIMHGIGGREMERIVGEYIRFEIDGWRSMMKI